LTRTFTLEGVFTISYGGKAQVTLRPGCFCRAPLRCGVPFWRHCTTLQSLLLRSLANDITQVALRTSLACVSTIASPSLSLRSCQRLDALLVCSRGAHQAVSVGTSRRPSRWPRILSVSALSIKGRLVVQLLSLSLSLHAGKCSFSPHSPQHRPMAGKLVLTVRSALSAEFRSGRRRWYTLRCGSAAPSLGGGIRFPTAWPAAPSAVRSQPARAIAPPIVG